METNHDRELTLGRNIPFIIILICSQNQETRISVPGYKYAEHSLIGDATVTGDKVTLGKYGVAVLVYEKQK